MCEVIKSDDGDAESEEQDKNDEMLHNVETNFTRQPHIFNNIFQASTMEL